MILFRYIGCGDAMLWENALSFCELIINSGCFWVISVFPSIAVQFIPTTWRYIQILTSAEGNNQSCCPQGLDLASRSPFGGLGLGLMARSWPWIKTKAKTFLRFEKSPEHFQINDAEFVWCSRTMCVQQQLSAK